ncbi:MAG: hypothetical protein M1818_002751 [Claussenomyces sp. TS43310]|nr:MAG: hypothetical protein M1818_002751 [Claussenomyces sp. TS43310]
MIIGVAIIGSGIFATQEHLPAVQACPNLALKAIYSRSLKSAKALGDKAGSVDLYSDDSGVGKTFSDLLSRKDIDAVTIALPIPSQPEYIEAALRAGKHVLSEKPIAGDLDTAIRLIQSYENKIHRNVIWAVGENFRFLMSFKYAAEEAARLGRVLGFRVKMFTSVKGGSKYYGKLSKTNSTSFVISNKFAETTWRKKPEYQGGFLLDGGVHYIAGTRRILGSDPPASISAYTTLLQNHLPPVDTVNAIWQTESGASGTFSVSFGTTFSGRELHRQMSRLLLCSWLTLVLIGEYSFAFEKGTVNVVDNEVTTVVDGKSIVKDFSSAGSGVKQEVAAFAESITKGKVNPSQSPAEALADLEILERMLKSGEGHGKTESLKHQMR